MPYVLRNQHGQYLQIIDYGNQQYSIKTLNAIGADKPTVYKDGWDVRRGADVIEIINQDRKRYIEQVKRMGLKVSHDSIDKLELIEVTPVEVMLFKK